MGGLRRRIQRIQDWPPVRRLLQIHQRYNELGGGLFAAAVTLAVFVALVPLLLVMIAVIGFVSANNDDVAADLISNLGVTGELADLLVRMLDAAEEGRGGASIIGLLGLIWTSLRIAGAIEQVCNRSWQVPGRGPIDKLRAVGWLVVAVVLVGASLTAAGLLGVLPVWLAPLQVLASVGLLTAFFLFTFTLLTAADVPTRAHLPGAVVMGVGFHVLTVLATVIVPRQIASSSALYGSVGAVFALLAYLLLFGRLLVYAVVLDVLRWEERHGTVHVEVEAPRFSGEVPTTADRSATVHR